MKARTPPQSYSDYKRLTRKEFEEYRYEVYVQAANDLIPQCMATFLWTMVKYHGWGEKRLRKLVDDWHDVDSLMENPSRLHSRFSPLDCEKEIKERFGIDIRAEFPIKVEVQK